MKPKSIGIKVIYRPLKYLKDILLRNTWMDGQHLRMRSIQTVLKKYNNFEYRWYIPKQNMDRDAYDHMRRFLIHPLRPDHTHPYNYGEIKKWCEENLNKRAITVTNNLFDFKCIQFESLEDATLFKLFWN